MRPEYPSGLFPGPGIGRSWVRFPAPRRSFRGHFFVNFGMSWDVSGSGLGTFWDGFGTVLKKCRMGSKNGKKMSRSIFPASGYTKIRRPVGVSRRVRCMLSFSSPPVVLPVGLPN